MAAPAASFTVTVHEMSSFTRTYVVDMAVCPIHDNVDDAVADVTLNVNVLPVSGNVPVASFSVIWNDAVMAAGAVKKNVNVDPPLVVANVMAPAPVGPYVGAVKSDETPVVAPAAFFTVTVHDKISRMRTTVVDALVWPTHVSVDDVDGTPSTANENVLPVMAVPPLSFSVITNEAVITVGAVTKKLKVAPPFVVASVAVPLPDGP